MEGTSVAMSPPHISREKNNFVIKFLFLILFFVFLTLLFFYGKKVFASYKDKWWSPIILVLLQAIQVVVFPLPGQIISVISGFMYGLLYGTLISITGIWIGGTVSMLISRYLFRDYFYKIVMKKKTEIGIGLYLIKNPLYYLPFFFIPNPFGDLIMYIMGLSRANILLSSLVILIGRMPGTFLYSLIGFGILKLTGSQLIVFGTVSFILFSIYTLLFRRILKRRLHSISRSHIR